MIINILSSMLLAVSVFGQTSNIPNTPLGDIAKKEFQKAGARIPTEVMETIPVLSNGRIKPLDTFTREVNLFLTGSRAPMGLNPVQFYFDLITYDGNMVLEFIEVRNKTVREKLGFKRDKRFFSINELAQGPLETLARPLFSKEQENSRSLSPDEKEILEVAKQFFIAKEVTSGENFLSAIDLTSSRTGHMGDAGHTDVIETGKQLLRTIANQPESVGVIAQELKVKVMAQEVPTLFQGYQNKLGLEVSYNKLRPFLIVGILYFILSALFVFGLFPSQKIYRGIIACIVPWLLHFGGFAVRIYITGFAPVTNMYTTMLWVSFGVVLFSIVLLALYKNFTLVGLLLFGSSLVLLLAEGFPLMLSPDMDPIVAVLRSNYWLTLHVLTVTISYAAFTICMLIGNTALLRSIFGKLDAQFLKSYAHYTYRMAQLGVCLISAGIILGGIWADYSWGRFWGWDPKETWALIADMGFIIILHARHVGWLRDFGTLAAAPVAYLLVIMAWYGVNFILAAGLHSYGFSSGGATAVGIFVSIQIILVVAGLLRRVRAP